MPTLSDERRQDMRLPLSYPVTICAAGRKRRARTIDLSVSGARIGYENSQIDVPAGAHRLRIQVAAGEDVEVVALPVWRSRFSYGVKFLLTTEMERLAVAEIMDRRDEHHAA